MMPTDKYGYLVKDTKSSTEITTYDFVVSISASTQNPDYASVAWRTRNNWASFEQDRFILQDATVDDSKKLKLASSASDLGIITTVQTDTNGTFTTPITVLLDGGETYVSQNGLTVVCANFIESATIKAYRGSTLISSSNFTGENTVKVDEGYFKTQKFFVDLDTVNKIELIVRKLDKPFNFFYMADIILGVEQKIGNDETKNLTATNKFSLYGDTIEYSTLNFDVFSHKNYSFLKDEKITLTDENSASNFYTRSYTENNQLTSVNCEDVVSFWDKKYVGGFFENESFVAVFDYITFTANVGPLGIVSCWFESELFNTKVSGFLPPGTAREAIKQLMLTTGVRLYKEYKTDFNHIEWFKVFKNELNAKKYDETNIIGQPEIIKNEPVNRVIIRQHHYTKSNEEVEVYHFKSIKGTTTTFDEPLWDFKVYEEKSENEIVEAFVLKYIDWNPIENRFFFLENTSFPIIVKAKKYTDSIIEYEGKINQVSVNSNYVEKVFDFYLDAGNTQEICDLLCELYSRPYSIRFRTLDRPELGGYYDILGHKLNICSVTEDLSGVYEVEAR